MSAYRGALSGGAVPAGHMKTGRCSCFKPAPIPSFPQLGKGPDSAAARHFLVAVCDSHPLWGRAGVGALPGFLDAVRQAPQRALTHP